MSLKQGHGDWRGRSSPSDKGDLGPRGAQGPLEEEEKIKEKKEREKERKKRERNRGKVKRVE